MSMITALEMFYNTRHPEAVHITDSKPSNSPNTELKHTPESAVIRYESGVVQEIPKEYPEAPDDMGYETSQFLISRAMMDPDATVEPK